MFNFATFDPSFFLKPFLIAFGVSLCLTYLVRLFSLRFRLFDWPGPRRLHLLPVPRLGGVAIFLSFVLVVFLFIEITPLLQVILLAAALLFLVGVLDDICGVNAYIKLATHVLAGILVFAGGVHIANLRIPFLGVVELGGSLDFFLTVAWIVILINAVNVLDGLDGLATGVGAIAGLTIFVLSLFAIVNQPITALLAIILVGALVGFLPFNFHPARIFLGDSGSQLVGFFIAVLATMSGSKVVTASLVLGIAILDGFWAVVRRWREKKSILSPDTGHLHHLFLKRGFRQGQVVAFYYLIAVIFGILALLSDTSLKLVVLLTLFCFVLLLIYWLKPSKNR